MATKRSHQTYASDSLPPPTYTTYGTPLPPSPSARDDGTYLPLWKQDVRDEHGRKRLHGAFAGGWSAGYFNTVGSKEGWTPSTFVSSRGDRRKDDKKKNEGTRVEDFMDEEDLADHSEAQKLQTSEAFAGLGDGGREDGGGLTGLFRAKGDTMGAKLLRRMGWNDGQGIGPKIRRGARLDTKSNGGESGDQTYMFAPDNAPMINFTRKTDRKGLGHLGEAKLSSTPTPKNTHNQDEDDTRAEQSKFSVAPPQQKKPPRRTGIGVGILNEDGSDEEDPYEVGPKISYNRIMGGDKKKKKKAKAKENVAVNPSLGTAPVFLTKSARGLRRSHDGRLPLDGFILAKVTEDFSTLLSAYTPPPVPEGWVSSKQRESSSSDIPYTSTTDAAKNSTLDPKSRASLLGEAPLPGKSVFDFLSSSTRDRLAAASGKGHLPQGKGEIPEEYRLTAEEKHVKLWQEVAKVDKDTAIAALGRTNGGPYADNEAKRERYRYFLSACAYPDSYAAPEKRKGGSEEDFIREMAEFHACAGLFKPLTGAAASRFASTTTILGAEPAAGLSKPVQPEKPSDPAMEAAKMGMFGKMTRMEETWFPSRLLCKRFNVKPPEHVQAGVDAEKEKSEMSGPAGNKFAPASNAQAGFGVGSGAESGVKEVSGLAALPLAPTQEKVDSERNDAVEAGAAHAEALKAIFGDSDSE